MSGLTAKQLMLLGGLFSGPVSLKKVNGAVVVEGVYYEDNRAPVSLTISDFEDGWQNLADGGVDAVRAAHELFGGLLPSYPLSTDEFCEAFLQVASNRHMRFVEQLDKAVKALSGLVADMGETEYLID